MGRKPRVDRSPEEKWQIVQEGIKSGNVSETYRRYGIAPNLLCWLGRSRKGCAPAGPYSSASYAEMDSSCWLSTCASGAFSFACTFATADPRQITSGFSYFIGFTPFLVMRSLSQLAS